MKYVIHTDGICEPNPGHAAWAYVVSNETGEIVHSDRGYIGPNATNNVAEYRAMIEALVYCHEMESDEFLIYSDSQLVVNQLNGAWQVHSENIRSHFDNARDLIEPHMTIEWIPGAQNLADHGTRLAYEEATGLWPEPREKGARSARLVKR